METFVKYHIALSQLYERGDGKGQSGAIHLYLPFGIPFASGRLKRPHGGTVCGKQAWDYRDPSKHEAPKDRCTRCVQMAARHGIPWPPGWRADGKVP